MIIKDENKITHSQFVDYCDRYGLNPNLARTLFDFMDQVRGATIRMCDNCGVIVHEEHLHDVWEDMEFCEDCIRDI
jgi:hypothetical protein